jgi:hypothetical protein
MLADHPPSQLAAAAAAGIVAERIPQLHGGLPLLQRRLQRRHGRLRDVEAHDALAAGGLGLNHAHAAL